MPAAALMEASKILSLSGPIAIMIQEICAKRSAGKNYNHLQKSHVLVFAQRNKIFSIYPKHLVIYQAPYFLQLWQ
ncbi:MAG: hypothetical protein ACD_21C00267G0003 [uncultured bacterium]|nr:MAG: hypothetical protein ACD_21C00267G0003 [uncultured bacterium]